MKPLTTSQTIAVLLVILCAWGFMSNDDYNNQVFVADIIRDSTDKALVVQSKDEWVALVDQGDEMLSLKEVHRER